MQNMENNNYKVLAQKYRPKNLQELIGQDVLATTLTNAIKTNRIANAYIFTGIRGVGKTSTARIFAKSLNCIGVSGTETSPQITPCEKCEHCLAISEDRDIDVIEMDAASRTGVDDIREIIDGVQYKPTSARYKIYIIDEVHMLSKSAFNALLKTLEEPPAYSKFIFATTEIRKVPATILSRCQRFDLSRVDIATLSSHFKRICEIENVKIDDASIKLIAKTADGSVRDGISLLDQVISNKTENIVYENVSKILGITSKSVILELYENLVNGTIDKVINIIDKQYKFGCDPVLILTDLLEITHFITRTKITPEFFETLPLIPEEQIKIKQLAEKLNIAYLSRIWQLLLKGFEEIKKAPNILSEIEMLLIRISYIGGQPTPDEILKQISTSSSGEIQKKNNN